MIALHHNIIIAFMLSFFISVFVTNVIIKYSVKSGIGDNPSEKRKIHKRRMPNTGGLAVFIGSIVAYFSFSDYHDAVRPDKLFSIGTLIFFMGFKDDLEPMLPKVRLIVEFLCAFFIIYITDIRLETLWGIFTITDLPLWASYILSALFIVTCINAYNLIDGIDGLLGSLSLFAVFLFSLIFNAKGEWLWTLLCISLGGALIGFLVFNWHKARIFMGNGGALFLGTVLACIALHTMQNKEILHVGELTITMPHTMAFAIIAIPLVDLVSVFTWRIAHEHSPFAADNSHIHHRLLNLGMNHNQACITIIAMNVLIVIFAYLVQSTGALKSLLYTIGFAFLLELLLIIVGTRFAKKKEIED